MKSNKWLWVVAIAATLGAVALCRSTSAAPSPNKPTAHVSCGGKFVDSVTGDTVQAEFNAKNQKGETKGHARFAFPNGSVFLIDVDCLDVVGNEAWLSGIITEGPNNSAGFGAVWRIVDNGEGHGAVDQISLLVPATTTVCTDRVPFLLEDLVNGNIQVR